MIDSVVKPDDTGPPIIYSGLKNVSVGVGDEFFLEPFIGGKEPLVFEWFKNGQPISDFDGSIIEVFQATPEDAGIYKFQVSNSLGSVESDSALVWVAESNSPDPAWVENQPGEIVVKTGQEVVLESGLIVDGVENLQWNLDGLPLDTPGGRELILNPVTSDDQGFYSLTFQKRGLGYETMPQYLKVESAGGQDMDFLAEIQRIGEERSFDFLSDGSVVVGGDFNQVQGREVYGLIKINADGQVDWNYTQSVSIDGKVNVIQALADDKVYVGGDFVSRDGVSERSRLARLNPDGSIDNAFGEEGRPFGQVYDIEVNPDGSLWIGGHFYYLGNNESRFLGKLSSNGQVAQAITNGNGPDYTVTEISALDDGTLLLKGNFSTFQGVPCEGVAWLRPDASLLPDFRFSMASDGYYAVYAVSAMDSQRIVVGGYMSSINGTEVDRVALLDRSGHVTALDTPLNHTPSYLHGISQNQFLVQSNGGVSIYTVENDNSVNESRLVNSVSGKAFHAAHNNGRWFLGGDFDYLNNSQYQSLIAIETDGALDEKYNYDFRRSASIQDLVVNSNDEIYMSGQIDFVQSQPVDDFTILRPDGTLSAKYLNVPQNLINGRVSKIEVLENGKTILAGSISYRDMANRYHYGMVRLNEDGSLDESWNPDSIRYYVYAVEELSNGNLAIAGSLHEIDEVSVPGWAVLSPEGRLLTRDHQSWTYLGNVDDILDAGSGNFYLTGDFNSFGGRTMRGVVRILDGGIVDPEFYFTISSSSYSWSDITAAHLQSDGSLIVSGYFDRIGNLERKNLGVVGQNGLPLEALSYYSGNQIYNDLEIGKNGHLYASSSAKLETLDPDSGSPVRGQSLSLQKGSYQEYFRGITPHGEDGMLVWVDFNSANGRVGYGLVRMLIQDPDNQSGQTWVQHPEDQFLSGNDSVEWRARLGTDEPALYYWYWNGELIAGPTLGGIRLDNLQDNQSGVYQVQAVTGDGPVWGDEFDLEILGGYQHSGYQEWITSQGISEDLTHPTQDFDFDGIINFAEYVFGAWDSGNILQVNRRSDGIGLLYKVNNFAEGFKVHVEHSADFENWNLVPFEMIAEIGSEELFSANLQIDPEGIGYFRIRVELLEGGQD